jgi:hypothetical protein
MDKLFNLQIKSAEYNPNVTDKPDPVIYPDPKDDPNVNPNIPLYFIFETYPDPQNSTDSSKNCKSYSKYA